MIGTPSGMVPRGMTAGVIAYHYVPYSITALHTRIGPHTARFRTSMKRFFRSRYSSGRESFERWGKVFPIQLGEKSRAIDCLTVLSQGSSSSRSEL